MSVKDFKEQIARKFCDLICPDEHEICTRENNFCGTNLKRVEELLSLKSKDGLRLAIVTDDFELPQTYFDNRKKMPWVTDYDVEKDTQRNMIKNGFVKEVK